MLACGARTHRCRDRVYAVGMSLGGNALLKWLGRRGAMPPPA